MRILGANWGWKYCKMCGGLNQGSGAGHETTEMYGFDLLENLKSVGN